MTTNKPKAKPKPPSEKQYRRAEIQIALEFCPEIRECKKCHWPHVGMYCCTFCGAHNPDSHGSDEE